MRAISECHGLIGFVLDVRRAFRHADTQRSGGVHAVSHSSVDAPKIPMILEYIGTHLHLNLDLIRDFDLFLPLGYRIAVRWLGPGEPDLIIVTLL